MMINVLLTAPAARASVPGCTRVALFTSSTPLLERDDCQCNANLWPTGELPRGET